MVEVAKDRSSMKTTWVDRGLCRSMICKEQARITFIALQGDIGHPCGRLASTAVAARSRR